ncbi:hypothetical protein N7478_012756 [Penicillium angulare]|uniref:uncharacterized protein n=1 Tax=Penicillium angulare TaxID=116970 RepID=UPI00254205CE|nr:uncharacterized protein N7478_012756 [Penicillium angulare]KAJ5256652.1 hypothetical protein N7478_012756 [Penicillium angulare]
MSNPSIATSTPLDTTQPEYSEALRFHRQYNTNATILLVGFFGAGKKTLGIIASVALRRRLIEFDSFFKKETQALPQEFIACHGLARYREVELEVSRTLLAKNATGCVIVGLGGSASHQLQVLLGEFAQTHPVVYIRRDEADLRSSISASLEKFEKIFEVGNAFFKSCSNFDFFNHTQDQTDRGIPTYLKLKETERVFVAFLRRVFQKPHREAFSVNPFSASNTYALQISLSWMNEPNQDLEALEIGVDAIILVIESGEISSSTIQAQLLRHISTLRTFCRVPIIIDISDAPYALSTTYFQILEMILRMVPDAIMCSLNHTTDYISKFNLSKGGTKIIGTIHTPSQLGSIESNLDPPALIKKVDPLKLDALRITGESTAPNDHVEALSFIRHMRTISNLPIIAYNKGPLGRASICLNPTLSPVSLRSTTGVTLQAAQQALSACFLLRKKTFHIFGQGVKHTLSPAMHNMCYATSGLPHTYHTFPTEDITDVEELLTDETQGGITISLPFKSAIIPYLDFVSSDARDMNAVNTVVLEHQYPPSGGTKIVRKGFNTDYIGIRDCIYKYLSPANAVRDGTSALIIGAGGMAQAAVYACHELGIQHICIYNRTPANGEKLVDYYHKWAESRGTELRLKVLRSVEDVWPEGIRLPTIVVACIPPYKMDGADEGPVVFNISENWLASRTGGVFVEVAYGPFRTPLMEQMLSRSSKGWVMVDGLKVLLEQGIAQYELFTKRPAPIHVMRRAIQEQSMKYGFIH